MRISDLSSDVCSSDLGVDALIAVFVPPVAVSVDRYAQALMAGMADSGKPVVTTFLAVEGIPKNLTVLGPHGTPARGSIRSEERRVGKECVSKCRSRWSPDH